MTMGTEAVFLPTPAQALLLHASLDEGEAAIAAWQQWREQVDLDAIDAGSLRLIPLLWYSLSRAGVQHPLMARYQGIHRHFWVRHQLVTRRLSTCLGYFESLGLPVVALKGLPLAFCYYPVPHTRPMLDVDLLLPPARIAEAGTYLTDLGWGPLYPEAAPFDLARDKSMDLINDHGDAVDLHWQIAREFCVAGSEAPFWERSVLRDWQGLPIRWPAPTHLLLHVCLHAAAWNKVSPIRWVADAMMVLRHPETQIDWPLLLELTYRYRLVLPMRATLGYLKDAFEAPIPATVLAQLRRLPCSAAERLEYRKRLSDWGYQPLFGGLPLHWADHCRRRHAQGKSGAGHLLAFPEYLRWVWGLPSRQALVPYLVHRLRLRLRRTEGAEATDRSLSQAH